MINFSMMNGIVDAIADFFANALGWIFDLIMDLFAFIFYWLFCLIGELADMIQALFRAFCGLGNSSLINGKPTDDVYDLFLSPQVTNVLISLGVLAIFLLIITTAIAVVKTEFVGFGEKGQNSKSKVIGTSLKALANIFIVPLCCILGVVAVNAVLRAVDGATGGGQQVSLARQVFVATAKGGSKLRTNFSEEFNTGKCSNAIEHGINTFGLDFKSYIGVAGGNGADSNPEKFALVVDYLFLHNESFGEDYLKAAEEGRVQIVSDSEDIIDTSSNTVGSADDGYDYYVAKNGGWGIANGKILRETSFDYTNKGLVRVFYDLSNFNIIVALLAAIMVAFNLLTMILTVIKRMFELIVLFVISPPIVAITPIDGGSALKNWRQSFVSSLLAVFGPIVAINMLFIILPLIFQIDFLGGNGLAASSFTEFGADGIQSMAEILITCAAISYVKDLSGTIAKMLGSTNAMDTDSATKAFSKNVKTAKSIGKTMGTAAKAPVSALNSAFKSRAKGEGFGKGLKEGLWGAADDIVGGAIGVANDVSGAKFNTKARAQKAYNSLVGGFASAGGFLTGGSWKGAYKTAGKLATKNKEFDMTNEQKWARDTAEASKETAKYTHELRNNFGTEEGSWEYEYDKDGNITNEKFNPNGTGLAARTRRMQEAIGDPNRHKDGTIVEADQLVNRARETNYRVNAIARDTNNIYLNSQQDLGIDEAHLREDQQAHEADGLKQKAKKKTTKKKTTK